MKKKLLISFFILSTSSFVSVLQMSKLFVLILRRLIAIDFRHEDHDRISMSSTISECNTLASEYNEDCVNHHCDTAPTKRQSIVKLEITNISSESKRGFSFFSRTLFKLRRSLQTDQKSVCSKSANANINEACIRHSTISSSEAEDYV